LISFQPRLAMPFPLTSFTVIPRNDRQREPTVYQETAERALRDFGPSAAGPCPLRAKSAIQLLTVSGPITAPVL
jgi:hypothetical protein